MFSSLTQTGSRWKKNFLQIRKKKVVLLERGNAGGGRQGAVWRDESGLTARRLGLQEWSKPAWALALCMTPRTGSPDLSVVVWGKARSQDLNHQMTFQFTVGCKGDWGPLRLSSLASQALVMAACWQYLLMTPVSHIPVTVRAFAMHKMPACVITTVVVVLAMAMMIAMPTVCGALFAKFAKLSCL